MMYKISLTRLAEKDAKKIEQTGLKPKTGDLLRIIKKNPFQNPPPYEKLQGYEAAYSRRITGCSKILTRGILYIPEFFEQPLAFAKNKAGKSGVVYNHSEFFVKRNV